MPSTSNICEGIVSNSDGVVIENVDVTINNTSLGESHSSGDSGFSALKTNSAGEWSANLGNFTGDWTLGDNITYSGSHGTWGSDLDTTTVVTGGRTGLNLVLSTDAVNRANTAINNKGETVDLYSLNTANTVYRENYGDIDAESFTASSITASIQQQSDDSKLMEWGVIEEGEALGFFKAKNTVKRGDKIRVPATIGSWWTIMKAVPHRPSGALHHYECVLTRISDDTVSLAVAGTGTTVAFTLHSTRALGSALTGTSGEKERVMTIGTTQLGSGASVFSSTGRIDPDDLTITYATELITITFTNKKIWDDEVIVVDYAT